MRFCIRIGPLASFTNQRGYFVAPCVSQYFAQNIYRWRAIDFAVAAAAPDTTSPAWRRSVARAVAVSLRAASAVVRNQQPPAALRLLSAEQALRDPGNLLRRLRESGHGVFIVLKNQNEQKYVTVVGGGGGGVFLGVFRGRPDQKTDKICTFTLRVSARAYSSNLRFI